MATVGSSGAPRDQWRTKMGFILAAAGSAIGLGNIWRYPYVAYENGGGAFLLPYFIALATAGIPILILEYGLGHRSGRAAPLTFRSISRRWEWLGWWQAAISFMIMSFYGVVIAWALSYAWYSVGTQWGDDPNAFFEGTFLNVADSFWSVGPIQPQVLVPVLVVWAVIYLTLRRGVPKGIEVMAKALIPSLLVLTIIIVLRGISLDGAITGLEALFRPDFGALADAGVWVAAYGQVFFSLSIGFSIMIVYSSYLPRRTDLPNTAVIVGLSNAGFEFLAAIGVFSVIGFLAVQQNLDVADAAADGPGLAFVVFPEAINQLPALNSLFGVLFFAALVFAGLTSAVSILEAGVAGIREKFNLSRTAAVNWLCGLCALVSLLYTTRGGLYYLDTIDHFVNHYGLVVSGLVQVILVAWVARQVRPLQEHVNRYAYLRAGRWWLFALMVLTPVLLGVVMVFNLHSELTTRYESYPLSGLLIVGWGVVVLTLVFAWIMPALKRQLEEPSGEGSRS